MKSINNEWETTLEHNGVDLIETREGTVIATRISDNIAYLSVKFMGFEKLEYLQETDFYDLRYINSLFFRGEIENAYVQVYLDCREKFVYVSCQLKDFEGLYWEKLDNVYYAVMMYMASYYDLSAGHDCVRGISLDCYPDTILDSIRKLLFAFQESLGGRAYKDFM